MHSAELALLPHKLLLVHAGGRHVGMCFTCAAECSSYEDPFGTCTKRFTNQGCISFGSLPQALLPWSNPELDRGIQKV